MANSTNFEGIVSHIIYKNNNNSYTVFALSDENGDEIICTGYFSEIFEGENLEIEGNFTNHPSYGTQFNITSHKKSAPKTISGIEKYLSSGIIRGIGNKLAKKIIKKFGEHTVRVIEEAPEKLSEIKGITIKKALEIGAIFHEQSDSRNTMLALQQLGLSPAIIDSVYKKYKNTAVDVVKQRPYDLVYEVYGVGFLTADKIAQKVGIPFDSDQRIKAGVIYALQEATSLGHVYLPKNLLIQKSVELLDVSAELVSDMIFELVKNREVYIENILGAEAIYLRYFFSYESYVAKKILELSINNSTQFTDTLEKIRKFEAHKGITLAENQKQAVTEAVCSGVLVVTGGPGTGKTTIIKTIISILEEDGAKIMLAAPTGRAAKRLSEATDQEAKTIHRLLEISFKSDNSSFRQFFEKNEDNPLETDVLIVDECSMIDIVLMNALLKSLAIGTRLILVGDVDQLPSVGPGNVLMDIIESNCINVVRLNEIFRQSQQSAIIVNAHRINNGNYPILSNKDNDFFFIKKENQIDAISTITDLITSRLPNYKNIDRIKDIQVLSPMKKSPFGVINLNKVLQDALNPSSKDKKEKEFRSKVFREGDKVMQLKNNYSIVWEVIQNDIKTSEGIGIFNGDEGTVTKIDDTNETITVVFDENKFVTYEYSKLEEIDLAYAITIHKSQGSEYKVVVIPVLGGAPMLLNRNLLYTAVTRAKELCVMVGREEVLYQMVDNKKETQRYTSLSLRIRDMHDYIIEK